MMATTIKQKRRRRKGQEFKYFSLKTKPQPPSPAHSPGVGARGGIVAVILLLETSVVHVAKVVAVHVAHDAAHKRG